MRKIYCPWCSSELTQRYEGLFCNKGKAGLSKAVEDETMLALKAVQPKAKFSGPVKNNDYHCPNCACSLTYIAGKRNCNACGFQVRSGIGYMLTDYHDHEDWSGK